MFKKLFSCLILLILVTTISANATDAPVNAPSSLTTALDKLTLNQGMMYTIGANSVSYTMTTNLASWKGISLIGGYSTSSKAVVGFDYNLLNLQNKGIQIPLLKFVDVHLGWAATWDNIGGRNVVDNGPVVTIAQLSF